MADGQIFARENVRKYFTIDFSWRLLVRCIYETISDSGWWARSESVATPRRDGRKLLSERIGSVD